MRYAALKLLDKLELTPYFDYIGGSSPDASLDTKTAVIRHVLAQPCVQDKRAVMVGDRDNDMHGAADCGLPAVGVLYGYGFPRGAGTFCSGCILRRSPARCAWLLQRKIKGKLRFRKRNDRI